MAVIFDVLCMKNNAYKRVCDLYTAQKQATRLSNLIEKRLIIFKAVR